ncbi:hypothetical protein [Motiliproteus sp. MSK22-1]|uniref:hypothetical protein n=1 Tax=Motiliproteus sp. MSK22-1 TaxID=1897630 RepID=UPI000977B53A|nr:hypothetical protein [Motiliproteus sp. MSK22-1]OMH38809.1 hypothetical protein BGP75_00040 [Motiliproteus sp. MSK22-1]
MSIRVKFEIEKEVKHSVRYKEVVEDGRAPVVGSIYVQKWFAGDAKELTVTIEKESDTAQP